MSGPFRDLRAYLDFLDRRGALRRVAAPVDKDTELACIARWALESAGPQACDALLFEQVRGYAIPVAVHLYSNMELAAEALGCRRAEMLEHWASALDNPLPPRVVDRGPAHKIVRQGADASLADIPIPTWTPGRDAGPYLPTACVITRDPETGVQNLATYRVQIHSATRCGVFFGSSRQHGAMHWARWKKRGEPMPIALVVGPAPAISFAAAAKTAYGVDELTIAGALMGEAVEVVRGRTVDLLIPASAELVIEGFMPAHASQLEGPFGECLGYMNDAAFAPFMDVTAVTSRERPILHGCVQQMPPSDGHLLMELGALGPLWSYVTRKLRLTGLRDMAIAPGAAGVATLVVQVQKDHAPRAAQIGRALARLNFGQKMIVLVDEDIEIRDAGALLWGLSARVDPARDMTLIDNTTTWQLDPSVLRRAESDGAALGEAPYASSMVVIDATVKCAAPAHSLPTASLMEAARQRWPEFGLPPLGPCQRLTRMLANEPPAPQGSGTSNRQ